MPALPSGVILMWSGSIATIPAGYFLCDGTNGTPDLRDRFIPGAGGALDPGDAGGSATHTHNFTGDGHRHTLVIGIAVGGFGARDKLTTISPAVGTTQPAGFLPPYYALAYIMKS